MVDGFSDEDQWEKLKAWWRANGTFIIAGLVIGVVIVGGWRWWEHYQTQRSLAASAVYVDFQRALNQPDSKDNPARAIGKNLIKNYDDTPYAAMAALGLAKKAVKANQLDRATKHLQWVLDNATDSSLKGLTRLRLARVQIANDQAQQALVTLKSSKPGGFKSLYAQARGDALQSLGKTAKAHQAYQAALDAQADNAGNKPLLEMKLQQTASGEDGKA